MAAVIAPANPKFNALIFIMFASANRVKKKNSNNPNLGNLYAIEQALYLGASGGRRTVNRENSRARSPQNGVLCRDTVINHHVSVLVLQIVAMK